MNAVEIEEAVSKLAEAPFDAETFPYDFLQAFGLNDAGIRKLRSGDTNKSDLRDGPWRGGVLQRNKNNIHLLACPPGEVAAALDALRASPATAKHKARFILATDGQAVQAERFDDGEPLACDFKQLPDRFTFFLSLAGISTVKRILTRCAEDILLAREAHFPATIAEMYDPEAMDAKYPDLRAAHERNDETLERIYIGRRFRNDTERLEKLFELYTQMTARQGSTNASNRAKAKRNK